MTPQQRTAYTLPCFSSQDCANQIYRRILRDGKRLWSVILTVNLDPEELSHFNSGPLWHCSTALYRDQTMPVPLQQWTSIDVLEATRIARQTLRGVGIETHNRLERGRTALHWRRKMQPGEINGLSKIGVLA